MGQPPEAAPAESGPAGTEPASAGPDGAAPAGAASTAAEPASASNPGGARSASRPSPQSPPPAHRSPTPADLADLAGPFALTAGVQDPEPEYPTDPRYDEATAERGLRGLVGGGSSQVSVTAAMRARDASRPDERYLASAEANLLIVRRGWVPREELPRPGRH